MNARWQSLQRTATPDGLALQASGNTAAPAITFTGRARRTQTTMPCVIASSSAIRSTGCDMSVTVVGMAAFPRRPAAGLEHERDQLVDHRARLLTVEDRETPLSHLLNYERGVPLRAFQGFPIPRSTCTHYP